MSCMLHIQRRTVQGGMLLIPAAVEVPLECWLAAASHPLQVWRQGSTPCAVSLLHFLAAYAYDIDTRPLLTALCLSVLMECWGSGKVQQRDSLKA